MVQEKKYTLEKALEFTESMKDIEKWDKIDHPLFSNSLKLLADNGKEQEFKKIVDTYLELVKYSGSEDVKKQPHSFLDFICQGMDHGYQFSYVNKDQEIKMGNAQAMLHKLYF